MSIYNIENIKKIYNQLDDLGKLRKLRSDEIKDLKERRKSLRAELKKSKQDGYRIDELKSEIESLSERIDKEREAIVSPIIRNLVHGRIDLKLCSNVIGKHWMFTTDNLPTILALQLAKIDLESHYKVKVANRDYVIRTLKMILDNDDPKIIIRADIKSFFESIDFTLLLEKLKRDAYVSPITVKCLKIVKSQLDESSNCKIRGKLYNVGVPRGLSISSHLSELYMTHFDNLLKTLSGVYFYQRYVDDIVIVANPRIISVDDLVKAMHETASLFALELHGNDGKWKVFDSSQDNALIDFEYLGYRFNVVSGEVNIGLSRERLRRYIKRIDAVFTHYCHIQHLRKKKDDNVDTDKKTDKSWNAPIKRLYSLMEGLTGNGLMTGTKGFIPVGVYYSNKHITTLSDFEYLDQYLTRAIEERFNPALDLFNFGEGNNYEENVSNIKKILHSWSFVKGFHERQLLHRNQRYLQAVELIKKLTDE